MGRGPTTNAYKLTAVRLFHQLFTLGELVYPENTRQELADLVGVNPATIRRYENFAAGKTENANPPKGLAKVRAAVDLLREQTHSVDTIAAGIKVDAPMPKKVEPKKVEPQESSELTAIKSMACQLEQPELLKALAYLSTLVDA